MTDGEAQFVFGIIFVIVIVLLAFFADPVGRDGVHCTERDVGANGQSVCVQWDR